LVLGGAGEGNKTVLVYIMHQSEWERRLRK
jgi:hypothetical protein